MQFFERNKEFRHILILESRDWWGSCREQFDSSRDLLLTFDYGLHREVTGSGGQAFYIDHLVDNREMQENNFLVYKFLQEWFLDCDGRDIFTSGGVPFGAALRIEIWNDIIFYVRNRICLESLKGIRFEKVFVGTQLGLVENILNEMELPFVPVARGVTGSVCSYYFPIHQWMDEKIRFKGLGGVKYRIRDLISAIQGALMLFADRFLGGRTSKPAIFVQEYHPTRRLVQQLMKERRVRLTLATFSRSLGWFRYVPVWGRVGKYKDEADALLLDFHVRRCTKLVLTSGIDVSEQMYQIIEDRIKSRVPEALRTLHCVISYLDKNPIELEVLIANIGLVATMVDCVCKIRKIPSYFIINGLLGSAFLDEGKYATMINGYSTSIKEHYFGGADNVVSLGDPRMDPYIRDYQPRRVNRDAPTITIGTAAHSIVDLNSYLAFEFDFFYDVLSALQIIKERGIHLRIVIKLRANGYSHQYREFVQEYFPGLVDEILDLVPMNAVLEKTDFYISTYSQTLFEASCMGVPCLYYKKDNEICDPPFDGDSELVTVGNVDDLVAAITDFRSGHTRFNDFLDRSVMEKYVGPLDGGNLKRNLDFIYSMLGVSSVEAAR